METISKWEETNDKLYGDAMKAKDKALMDSLDEVGDNVLKRKKKSYSSLCKGLSAFNEKRNGYH